MEDWEIPDYPTPKEMQEANEYLKEKLEEAKEKAFDHLKECEECRKTVQIARLVNELWGSEGKQAYDQLVDFLCEEGIALLKELADAEEDLKSGRSSS
jgi:hypothetical protein